MIILALLMNTIVYADHLGIGPMVGKGEVGVVAEGENHFKQETDNFGLYRYGEGQTRIELGTGFGVAVKNLSGASVVAYSKEDTFRPVLGIEGFNFFGSLNNNDDRKDFYEWLPMLGTGLGFKTKQCNIMPMVRAGAGIGNLNKKGWKPEVNLSYGAAGYVDCTEMHFSLEHTSIGISSLTGMDIMVYHKERNGLGIRYEHWNNEERAFIFYRIRPQ